MEPKHSPLSITINLDDASNIDLWRVRATLRDLKRASEGAEIMIRTHLTVSVLKKRLDAYGIPHNYIVKESGNPEPEPELLDTFLDLSNYALMAWCVVQDRGPEGFDLAQSVSANIFRIKNEKYGNAFFEAGATNAYNDIKRKYIRLHQMMEGKN